MKRFFLSLVLLGSAQALSQNAHAIGLDDTATNPNYCALIIPCDDKGEVLAPFNDPQSPCLEFYKVICLKQKGTPTRFDIGKPSGDGSDASCNGDVNNLVKQNSDLAKQVKSLTKQLRAAKRNSK